MVYIEKPKEKSFTTDDAHYLGLSPNKLEISTDLTSMQLSMIVTTKGTGVELDDEVHFVSLSNMKQSL